MSAKVGWAITGAGHLINETCDVISALDDVDVFISKAAEEVVRIYKIDSSRFPGKLHKDTTSSAPVCGKFAVGHYAALVVAPASANTVAKFVAGIADNLITNIFAQAGKSNTPIIVFPTDIEPEMLTMSPSGPVKVYPRKIDLDNTMKLGSFENVAVVRSLDELREAIGKIVGPT